MQENIIAILPEEVKGVGVCARVYTETGAYIDQRTPTLLLDNMYKHNNRNKKEMDKNIRSILQVSKNLPYVIDQNNVYFAFKCRQAIYDKQGRGFVNVRYVREIKNSQIVLTSGETIDTLNKAEALITNRNQALVFLYKEISENLLKENTSIRYLTANILRDNK